MHTPNLDKGISNWILRTQYAKKLVYISIKSKCNKYYDTPNSSKNLIVPVSMVSKHY